MDSIWYKKPKQEIVGHTKKASKEMDADPIYRADIAILLCELCIEIKILYKLDLRTHPNLTIL